ncbi:MAG: sulfatase-like hydrolase/transferase [Saprospiraceae bacterium]
MSQTKWILTLSLFAGIVQGFGQTRPNFVFILADDQSWNGTSVRMDPQRPESKSDFYLTPRLENFAKTGMVFSQGYAPAPKCAPSRISILTGKTTARLHFTFTDNIKDAGTRLREPLTELAIPDSLTTIAEWLKSRNWGYSTAHFGKWHLSGGGPARNGFDRSDGDTGNPDGNQGGLVQVNPRKIFSITDSACAFMADAVRQGKPFFVQLSHHAPRKPIETRQASLTEWSNPVLHPPGQRHKDPEYAAMMSDMDAGLGILFDSIKALGLDASTYIIYVADNGAGGNNFPLNGGKAACEEGGIRVPFIIAGPGIAKGVYNPFAVSGYDLFPTIAALAAQGSPVTLPSGIDGISLLSVIKPSGGTPINRPQGLYFHCPHYNENTFPQSALVDGALKLLVDYDAGTIALYNLDNDIGETKDLSTQQAETSRAMTIRLRDYLKTIQARMVTLNPEFTGFSGPAEDLDNDKLPDSWEFRELLTDRMGASDDPDKDGFSNLDEWKLATDPYRPQGTTSTVVRQPVASEIFRIIQNPFNEALSIAVLPPFQNEKLDVVLSDLSGKAVLRYTAQAGPSILLSTGTLPAGNYFLYVRASSGTTQTISLQKHQNH